MSLEELKKENIILKTQIKDLEEKLQKSEENIKKYTNSEAHKKYYLEHKEEVKLKGKAYLQKLKVEDPEKLKAYWRKSNEKRKLKKTENKNEIQNE
jgi:hypothetical protein